MKKTLTNFILTFVCTVIFAANNVLNYSETRVFVELAKENLAEGDWGKALASNFFEKPVNLKKFAKKIGFNHEENTRYGEIFWYSIAKELGFLALRRLSFEERVDLYGFISFLQSHTIVDIEEDYDGRSVTFLDATKAYNTEAQKEGFKYRIKIVGEINNEDPLRFEATGWSLFDIIDHSCLFPDSPKLYFEGLELVVDVRTVKPEVKTPVQLNDSDRAVIDELLIDIRDQNKRERAPERDGAAQRHR